MNQKEVLKKIDEAAKAGKTELDLSHNNLRSLPAEIGQLKNLTKLWLHDNNLTSLPAEIGQLKNLTELRLRYNPLKEPPPEIVEQGTGAVLAYLQELSKSTTRYWRGKLFMVGDGGVGKTHLLYALSREQTPEYLEATHGIEIKPLDLPHPKEDGVEMTLNCWDFGGQQIYHATHQFFFTNRSLFLLVWNSRMGFGQNQYEWLDTIKALAPDSPVLLVATHIDERDATLPYKDLKSKYPNIVGQWGVSCTEDYGIGELTNAIAQEASKLPQMGSQWPNSWAEITNEIQAIKNNYLLSEELFSIMAKHGVKGKDAGVLTHLLHDLGEIIFFENDENLNDFVILNYEWLTITVLKILDDEDIIKKNGVVTRDCIDAIWRDIGNKQIRKYLADLMVKFGLWYRISGTGDKYLLVSHLQVSGAGFEDRWDSIKVRKGCEEISIKFVLSSVPTSLLTRFIVRAHEYATDTIWRTGGLFAEEKGNGSLGLFKADLNTKCLILAVRGSMPQEFFMVLRSILEQILEMFPGLYIKRTVPCPGHARGKCSHEFDLGYLERAKKAGRWGVECPLVMEDVSVDEMIDKTRSQEYVVEKDMVALLGSAHKIAERERERYEAKLLIVGEANTGKTELVKAFYGEEFGGETATQGVLIRPLKLKHPEKPGVEMRLNLWDFGGQEIQHATHQFFYSERTLFLLVFNARENYEKAKLNDWLELIQARASVQAENKSGKEGWRVPVLLVATHCDLWRPDIPYNELQSQFSGIDFLGMVKVSNKPSRWGIKELLERLAVEASKLPYMGMDWPKDWQRFEDMIGERLEKKKNCMNVGELWRLMDSAGVSTESREPLARALDGMGKIKIFLDDDRLEEAVVLNPQWLTNRIARVLKNEDETKKEICKHAILEKHHWGKLWAEENEKTHRLFVQMMRSFDLVYGLGDKPNDAWLVVQLLSYQLRKTDATRRDELWSSFEGYPEIGMKFRFEQSVPPGIPTWFIAREHRFSLDLHWRLGVLLGDRPEEPRHIGLVQSFPEQRYVQIRVRGPMPHNFFALLRDGLELTLRRFPGLDIKRTVPCPGHNGEKCKHEFEFDNLQGAIELNKDKIQCPVTFKDVLIAELMFGLHWCMEGEVIKRIAELQQEMARDHSVMLDEQLKNSDELKKGLQLLLTESQDLKELAERGFTSLFNAAQKLEESHCPNVFTIMPKGDQGWAGNMFGQKMQLQLYCHAPGHWHPTCTGGGYEIKQPAEWLKTMAPYIVKLAKVLKYAAPLAGPAVGLASAAFAEQFKYQLKMMEELAKKLGDGSNVGRAALLGGIGKMGRLEQAEGAPLRALRELLDKVDSKHDWGGLKKILTPEGHFLWLCEDHAKEYQA